MPKASELKRGDVVDIKGQPYLVKLVETKSPSSRGAQTLYKIRFNNAQTGQKLDETFTGDDVLKSIDFARRDVQFLYQDGDGFIFMDREDYTQYSLDRSALEGQIEFLNENLEGIYGLLITGDLVGIDLPASVIMEILDTPPAIKGATASGRTKPATIAPGVEVQVPEYLSPGEKIKINTETGKFMSRA